MFYCVYWSGLASSWLSPPSAGLFLCLNFSGRSKCIAKPASFGHSRLVAGSSLSPSACDMGLTLMIPDALVNIPGLRFSCPLYLAVGPAQGEQRFNTPDISRHTVDHLDPGFSVMRCCARAVAYRSCQASVLCARAVVK